ncbi:MAG TPA: glycosyltransferase [Candidatus Methylomirabilis sp.]|nr:glycosyltransferase [Candidatus Methylomirabilis sp.]
MDDVSILIRTKNEARWLPVTVRAIHRQRVQPREIVVVDSGSTDGTLDTVTGLPGVRIHPIPPEAFTYGRALNLGFREAAGRYVACLSAHAVPASPDWLRFLLEPFKDAHVAGAYGRQLSHRDAYPAVAREYLEYYGCESRLQTSPSDHCFSNANSAIRKEAWVEVPFDETVPYCEDQLWARTVLGAGHRVAYVPEAAVYHSHNEPLAGVYRRARQEEMGWRRLYPDRVVGFRFSWDNWVANVARDARFIRRHGYARAWVVHTALFRLAQCLGRLQPHLVGAKRPGPDPHPPATAGLCG